MSFNYVNRRSEKLGKREVIVFEGVSGKTRKKSGKLFVPEPDKSKNGKYRLNVQIGNNGIPYIIIFGDSYNGQYATTLMVGMEAEYDSFNLIYTSEIKKITEKCVTFANGHRLDLYQFACRNWNFDLESIRERNAETSMMI